MYENKTWMEFTKPLRYLAVMAIFLPIMYILLTFLFALFIVIGTIAVLVVGYKEFK